MQGYRPWTVHGKALSSVLPSFLTTSNGCRIAMASAGAPTTGSCGPSLLTYRPLLTIASRYFTDSLANKIYAYDYDDGRLSGRRVFVDPLSHGLPEGTYPDGLCIDNAGGIWSARSAAFVRHGTNRANFIAHRWGGSRIIRYTPDGAVDLQVVFPTALNVTACCFGGKVVVIDPHERALTLFKDPIRINYT